MYERAAINVVWYRLGLLKPSVTTPKQLIALLVTSCLRCRTLLSAVRELELQRQGPYVAGYVLR